MKKIITFSFLVTALFSSTAIAATAMVCPTNITCNYEEGTCDQPDGWNINFFASSPFTGTQNMALSDIFGVKASAANIDPYDKIKKTKIECYYIPSGIKVVAYVKKLVGKNWSFDGFGKFRGTCTNISDPSQCAGKS